jgi:hypothetical protein
MKAAFVTILVKGGPQMHGQRLRSGPRDGEIMRRSDIRRRR